MSAISGGSASQNQCGEFYVGDADGESGGLGACHMAESVGYSFQNMMQSEASRCYMQRFPTAANVAAGGVSVVSGELPAGGIAAVFSPGTASRLVKINITGYPGGGGGEGEGGDGGPETIFIRIPSISQNAAAGKLFEAGLTFCGEGGSNGGESLSLFNNGRFVAESSQARGETESDAFRYPVTLLLLMAALSGMKPRRECRRWKVFRATVEASRRDECESLHPISSRLSRMITSVEVDEKRTRYRSSQARVFQLSDSSVVHSGGTPPGMGALSSREQPSIESSYYAAAPSSSLLDDLNVVNFSADEFYSATASPDVDSSGDCSATPDIELSLDMNNATVQASVAPCEQNQLRNMHFCHDDSAVQAADVAYGGSCHGGGGEGGGGGGEGPA